MHCHPHSPVRRDSMQRSPLAIAILCFGGLVGTGMVARAAQDMPIDGTPIEIHARALDGAPESRVEGGSAMDEAIAAALIGAIAAQFDTTAGVGIQLDRIAVDPASLRDRQVSGEGRLRIGDDGSWMPFRFRALYDTAGASVSYPYLVLGGGGTDTLATDSDIALTFDSEVEHALAQEFAQQPVSLSIDHVTAARAGERYLAVRAQGAAEFAGEGHTAARVRGLYDRDTGRWLRVEYELGAAAERIEPELPAIAAR